MNTGVIFSYYNIDMKKKRIKLSHIISYDQLSKKTVQTCGTKIFICK